VTTISDAMPEDQYNFWYEGKPWVGPEDRGIKEGDLRDGGSLAERSAAIGVWHQWPDNYDYVTERWDEFLNA
jgi:putative spermidine/putrescine transport system substrate-binding protein